MTRLHRSLAPALALLLPGLYGCGADVREAAPEAAGMVSLFAPGDAVEPWHPSIVRARRTHALVDVTGGEISPFAEPSARRVTLDLFEDARFEAERVDVERGATGFTWIGALDEGQALFSVTRGTYAGTVRAGDRLFQIAPRDGELVVLERDESLVPDEMLPLEADTPADTHEPQPGWSGEPTAATAVDVLVVYTAAARLGAGGEAAMAALVDLAVAETNQSYEKSGVPITLRLVHAAETTYDEAGFDWQLTLGRLRGEGDGFMDEVHALRDGVGADHVVLLVESATTYAGLGYQLTEPAAPFFAPWAFSVVSRSYASGLYTFAHELGHNMGAQHDEAHASGPGYALYSHGLQRPEAGYRTVMAYACDGGTCPRIDRWSSPTVIVGGAPTGIVGVADNARTLAVTASWVAGFRQTTIDPAPLAAILSPPDGATLEPGTIHFVFGDAGGVEYRLQIGDSLGGNEHFDASTGVDLEVDVHGLPEDGRTLFARLWTLDALGEWRFLDHHYAAATGDYGADLVEPAPGTTLAGTMVAFRWLPSGAEAYRLQVGTTADPTRFAAVDAGQATQALVVGLPHGGETVKARLGALGPDGWVWSEATFAGYTAPSFAARLSQPSAGGTLPGAAATFRWNETDALQHRLVIHDAAGNVFAGDPGPFAGMLVTGLPTDGTRVVATVLSLGPDGWASTSATYTAASP
jgi:hypothetical protein